ncbi:tyrosine-type recombinase/integrase [Desulfogranum mediterraneum]|uniref:tyrosine-type recombinase/integrase n=1 Tax=Desulfogranum mediterraneum TaxID=160661 RepID=UPI000686AA79|nr:tyrosine-type recombinase/integrase [Desulfogranum mediterraneum]
MKIAALIPKYLQHLKVIGSAKSTIKGNKYALKTFIRLLDEIHINELTELSRDVILEYQQELAYRLTSKGTPLTLRSQGYALGVVKSFCRYLSDEDYMLTDPAVKIVLPKKPKVLPKVIMDSEDIRKLLSVPDMRTNKGYRNRIVLEILYDTAIRAAEMAAVRVQDLDLTGGYLTIRSGKGAKDRVVPVSDRVCTMLNEYLLMVRPELHKGKDDGALILNRWGKQMTPNSVWAIVKRCVRQAGINKNISTHTFRHSCATHMLRNGAPIRQIQELLGHESLETTQIYTKVTINDLKEVHSKYHPSESL